jgi:nitrogen PTS system EIIA component
MNRILTSKKYVLDCIYQRAVTPAKAGVREFSPENKVDFCRGALIIKPVLPRLKVSLLIRREKDGSALNLTVREAAQLLKVTEKTVYRWIETGKLPATRVHDQYRFNRVELLEWATSHRVRVSPDIFRAAANAPALVDALRAGGVHYGLAGATRDEVLRAVVGRMPLPETVDREFLLQVLLAREELGSTGVGDGIAVPHVRQPVVLHVSRPLITLCFLKKPVDFGALDGRPVHVLFTLITPTVRSHLHLLSRLGFALRDADFKALLCARAPQDGLFAALARIEGGLAGPAGKAGEPAC